MPLRTPTPCEGRHSYDGCRKHQIPFDGGRHPINTSKVSQIPAVRHSMSFYRTHVSDIRVP